MRTVHSTHDSADRDLIDAGFQRYISCVDGRTLYEKWSTRDPFYGGGPVKAICYIQAHFVAPRWGDDQNYWTIEFLQ